MIAQMIYRPETKTADIVNAKTGETLRTGVALRDVPGELAKLRREVADAAVARRKAGTK